jgi:hypothetical protein
MMLPLLGAAARRRRLVDLLTKAERLETQLCNVIAQVVELTDPGDEIHVEMRALLEALDQ